MASTPSGNFLSKFVKEVIDDIHIHVHVEDNWNRVEVEVVVDRNYLIFIIIEVTTRILIMPLVKKKLFTCF